MPIYFQNGRIYSKPIHLLRYQPLSCRTEFHRQFTILCIDSDELMIIILQDGRCLKVDTSCRLVLHEFHFTVCETLFKDMGTSPSWVDITVLESVGVTTLWEAGFASSYLIYRYKYNNKKSEQVKVAWLFIILDFGHHSCRKQRRP